MLLSHLVPIHCSGKTLFKNAEMQEANVGEHHHGGAINES